MEKIKVLSIMHLDQFKECMNGNMPSQKMWGLYEMSQKKDIDLKILPFGCSMFSIIKEIRLFKPAVVYLPFFDSKKFFLAFLLKFLHIFNFKVFALCHFTIIPKSILGKLYWGIFYKAMDRVLFFSPKSLNDCVESGLMSKGQCEVIHWGMDLAWLREHSKVSYGEEFVSTGKENRDFRTLLKGFKGRCEKLIVFTKKENQGADYHYLEHSNVTSNIKILYPTEKNSFLQALKLSSSCKAYVIPLIKERIDYCVGHTSIVEAIALHKMVLSTYNPYYPINIEQEGIGYFVDANSPESWKAALDKGIVYTDRVEDKFEKLSQTYNIEKYAQEIYNVILILAKS